MLLGATLFLLLCCVYGFGLYKTFHVTRLSWGILAKIVANILLGCFSFAFGVACVLRVTDPQTMAGPVLKLFVIGLFMCLAVSLGAFLWRLWWRGPNIGAFLAEQFLKAPKWCRVIVGSIVLGGLILLFGEAFHIAFQQNHYKRLQQVARHIFQAEQDYYAQHGTYTANMEKLGVTLPNITQEEYRKGGYEYEYGQKVETPEIYMAQTKKGDSFLVQVMGVEDDPNALNLPTVLEIFVSGKFRSLPVSYSIRHFFGADRPEVPTLFQCDVLILHADTEEQAQRDIRKGGRFCKRLGASPTQHALIWLFEAK